MATHEHFSLGAEEREEAGCPVAGWRIEGIEGYFLANTRER